MSNSSESGSLNLFPGNPVFLQAILENCADPIAVIDQNGIFCYLSPAAVVFLGNIPELLISRCCFDFVPETDREHIMQSIRDLMNGNKETTITKHRVLRPDGFICWAETHANLLRNGKENYAVLVSRDITEKVCIEEALKTKEEKYLTIIENLGEGLAIVDTSERFTYANNAAAAIFGVQEGELTGRSLAEFITPESMQMINSETQKRILGQNSFYELEIIQPGGSKRLITVSATPLYDNKGGFEGTLGLFIDITENREAEAMLQKAYSELKSQQDKIIELEKIKAIHAMVVTANHELNQPLTVLKGRLAIMDRLFEKAKLTEQVVQNLEKMHGAVEWIAEILHKYREFESVKISEYGENVEMVIFKTDDPIKQ